MMGMIMIYLMSGAGTKVHVVFTSEHLMKRDQEEAADILLFIDESDSKVQYHTGIDF
jgi:preprotein translocase subunit SecA